MKTLRDLFLDELADIYDAEHRLVKALPEMAEAATCPHLKVAFTTHLAETKGHIRKLKTVFEYFGETARRKNCETTEGLLAEGEEIMEEYENSPAINAALICSAQKVEHHEIASYGCLLEWAAGLENYDAAKLLEEILDEEKCTDVVLTGLARSHGNPEAMGAAERGHAIWSDPALLP